MIKNLYQFAKRDGNSALSAVFYTPGDREGEKYAVVSDGFFCLACKDEYDPSSQGLLVFKDGRRAYNGNNRYLDEFGDRKNRFLYYPSWRGLMSRARDNAEKEPFPVDTKKLKSAVSLGYKCQREDRDIIVCIQHSGRVVSMTLRNADFLSRLPEGELYYEPLYYYWESRDKKYQAVFAIKQVPDGLHYDKYPSVFIIASSGDNPQAEIISEDVEIPF